MSNFRPLPRPSQASTNNSLCRSIWPKPRSRATGPARPWSGSQVSALLNFKAGRHRATHRVKALPFKAGTGGTAGRSGRREKKHNNNVLRGFQTFDTQAVCFSPSPFPRDVLIGAASVAQGLVYRRTQTCPRNGPTALPQACHGVAGGREAC